MKILIKEYLENISDITYLNEAKIFN